MDYVRKTHRIVWIQVPALALALTACTDFVERTRVTVMIDADAALHDSIRYVDTEVRSGSPNADVWELQASPRLVPRRTGGGWPVSFSFARSADENSDYLVTATAKDAEDETIAVVRAMSKYVKGQTFVLHMRFDDECAKREKMCSATFSCRRGECVDPVVTSSEAAARSTPAAMTPTVTTSEASEPEEASDAPPPPAATSCSGSSCRAPAADCEAKDKNCGIPMCAARDERGACLPCPLGFVMSDGGCSPSLLMLDAGIVRLEPELDPARTDYTLAVPLVVERVTLQLTAAESAHVLVDGRPLEDGQTWMSPPLPLGSKMVVITLNAPGYPNRTYTLELKRGGKQEAQLSSTAASAGDNFGTSVALSGDRLLVGATFEDGSKRKSASDPDDASKDSGAAYVFERSGTSWTQKAYVKAETPLAGSHFGYAVAFEGDQFAISAPQEPDGGAVYVFEWKDGVAVQTAVLSDKKPGAWFGRAIALQGDRLVVGAPSDSSDAHEAGCVYVYQRKDGEWRLSATLRSPTPADSDWLGSSVALDGDLLVSGATYSTPAGASLPSGVAYVFEHHAEGWKQVAVLSPTPVETGAYFGESVSVSGNTIAVGGFYGTAGFSAGAAYVFERDDAGEFMQQATLHASNMRSGDWFGERVVLTGDMLLVGTTRENSASGGIAPGATGTSTLDQSGAVYLFSRSSGTWRQLLEIKTRAPAASDQFGIGLAASGDTFVAGATADSRRDGSAMKPGAVYVFR